MNLKEELIKRGATDVQLKSKILEKVEEAIAVNEGVVSEAAIDFANSINQRVSSAEALMLWLESSIEKMKSDVSQVEQATSNYVEANKDKIISNDNVRDALLFYHHILATTQDVFGEENMTENVMMKTIEAASYGTWRAIMGGKFKDESITYRI